MSTVVLTRPADAASAWSEALDQAGWQVQLLPLICIGPPADPEPLQRLLQRVADHEALMWVSAAAVRSALADAHTVAALVAAGVRCWVTGPGTASALRAQGVPADLIDAPSLEAAQWDSEALWSVVAGQCRPGVRIAIVRGEEATAPTTATAGGQGRDWLGQQCRTSGAEVEYVVSYRRLPPEWSAADQSRIQQCLEQRAIWLFSSSQAIQHLQLVYPEACRPDVPVVVTHPRIAATAVRAGFAHPLVSRPAVADVLQALASLR